jgi:hypothetical protein
MKTFQFQMEPWYDVPKDLGYDNEFDVNMIYNEHLPWDETFILFCYDLQLQDQFLNEEYMAHK